MSKIDLLNEARLAWLHELLPNVGGRRLTFKTVNGKLRAVVDFDLLDLQRYLSFMQREFDVEFETYTTSGHLIPLEYSKEYAVEAYLKHSPLGSAPVPALFSQNEICPPTVQLFREKVTKELKQMAKQLKAEGGMRTFEMYQFLDYNYRSGKRTFVYSYNIHIDGRQTKRYKNLQTKYPLPQLSYTTPQSMTLGEAVNLLQYSKSLSETERKDYLVYYNLLQDWGLLC